MRNLYAGLRKWIRRSHNWHSCWREVESSIQVFCGNSQVMCRNSILNEIFFYSNARKSFAFKNRPNRIDSEVSERSRINWLRSLTSHLTLRSHLHFFSIRSLQQRTLSAPPVQKIFNLITKLTEKKPKWKLIESCWLRRGHEWERRRKLSLDIF